jgi:hypothetical protein
MTLVCWLGILGLCGGSLAMVGKPLEDRPGRYGPAPQSLRKESGRGQGCKLAPRGPVRPRRPKTQSFIIEVEAINLPWAFETWRGTFR